MLAQSPEVLNGCFFGPSGFHPGLNFLVEVDNPGLAAGGKAFCQCFRLVGYFVWGISWDIQCKVESDAHIEA
ncbi:hypothetical protein CIW60_22480 [Enterobacter roggenkampii]|uniref:hypothetical protein n=1 Tax=Enterobacter roggenkampii TaxID=1812935 RepID=UPI000401C48F|nr:hypothetical protein [Enterobacter roggenkampii]PAO05657.1 hypothetical protein CIW60_22480 [Enterobacter roggenkampii]WFC79118.1 hypothetical protein OM095_04315 [Enterobacter roggenkampii]HDR2877296.1 hypothetical protein [Enterobacter roggenkampii]HDR2877336.1 hypothetical protein [Enterobacter roggenkampii]